MKVHKIMFSFVVLIGLLAIFAIAMQWAHSMHRDTAIDPLPMQTTDLAHPSAERSTDEPPSTQRLGTETETYVTASVYMPIVMYHHIDDHPERFIGSTVTPGRLEADLQYFQKAGYETVSSEDLILYQAGKQSLPEQPLMITFDDGYLSAYTYAFPLLEKYDFKAVFNVIGMSIGRTTHLFDQSPIIPHFGWAEAEEMIDSGVVEIQSHSFGLHEPRSSRVDGKGVSPLAGESEPAYRERFATDILRNSRYIEEHLQQKVNVYAYPYGIYNDISEDVLRELGYVMTLTTDFGEAALGEDLFALQRINMTDYDSAAEALEAARNLRYTSEPTKPQR